MQPNIGSIVEIQFAWFIWIKVDMIISKESNDAEAQAELMVAFEPHRTSKSSLAWYVLGKMFDNLERDGVIQNEYNRFPAWLLIIDILVKTRTCYC